MGKITVQLCLDTHVIGFADIPLDISVVEKMSMVEKVYPVLSTANIVFSETFPAVGVSLLLVLENALPLIIEDSIVKAENHKVASVFANVPKVEPTRNVIVRAEAENETMNKLDSVKLFQYRFSIDLRSLQKSSISAKIYLRYIYSSVGNNSAIRTNPILHLSVGNQSETRLQSFNSFEFVMTKTNVTEILVPLIVEMWKCVDNSDDVLLGTATFNLASILTKPSLHVNPSIQSLEMTVPVLSCGKKDNLAELSLIIALEDFGAVMETSVPSPKKKADAHTSKKIAAGAASEIDLHDTIEYEVAIELEIWKQNQMREYKESLHRKEDLMNQKLLSEWKSREEIREKTLQKKLMDFKTLESQLETLGASLERRERSLVDAERLFERRREAMEHECEKTLNDARDTSRRLADDFKHKLLQEEENRTDLQKTLAKNKLEKESLERDYKLLDKEFFDFRKTTHSGDYAILQIELGNSVSKNTTLASENVELKTKLLKTKTRLVKIHQSYTKLQAEIAENKAKKHIKTLDLTDQVNKSTSKLNEREHGAMQENFPPGRQQRVLNDSQRREIVRLQDEKKSLLDTGSYAQSDPLILEIEKRIQSLCQ